MCRVRGGDNNLPGRILGVRPTRKWVRRLPQLSQEVLVRLWRHSEDNSPATRRRWTWTWVGDDRLVKQYGPQLGWVGRWGSGQEQRGRRGSEGLLLVVVIGEGKLVVPVDVTVRRADPEGPGGPCRDQLTWRQVMVDRTWTALPRRCRRLPPPVVMAESWCRDAGLRAQVATAQRGTLLVEGHTSHVCHRPAGPRVQGHALLSRSDWPWRESLHLPGVREARLPGSRPTYSLVTVVMVQAPGRERSSLRCRDTMRSAPRLIQAWRRRSWIEHSFRTLKHLLATEACQVQGEDAYYGHLVLRLVAGLVLLYTARVLFKGKVTMEEIVFSLKHHWRFLDSELLELQGLSWDVRGEAA